MLSGEQGVRVFDTAADTTSRSDSLRKYPADRLASPPEMREATARFSLGSVANSPASARPSEIAEPALLAPDMLSRLIAGKELSFPIILVSIMVALGLGALHALSPGHGKTIMAAYLVGTKGTTRHALFLGATVTVSHTLGVLGLSLVVLYASHLIAPELIYPWLGLVSGATIIGIGGWMALRQRPASQRGESSSHDHGHEHGHHHGNHRHPHISTERRPTHQHQDSKGRDGLRLTWRSLTALGIVGGLVPSTSALVLLLAAISIGRAELGLLLILAFSGGMAVALSGVGLALVYAGQAVERAGMGNSWITHATRRMPLITALVVLVSGLVVATRAASQLGLV